MQILRKQLMTRALFAGVCVILAVVVAVGYAMLYPPTTVRASSKYVSISVASSTANAGELTDTSDEVSKILPYYLGAGEYSLDPAIWSPQYEDATKTVKTIDNTFTVSKDTTWDWEMLNAGYNVKVKEDFTDGNVIQWESKGETIQIQPLGLKWADTLDKVQDISSPLTVSASVVNKAAEISPQGTITWYDAYGSGIDFSWECMPTRLKKTVTIDSFSSLPLLSKTLTEKPELKLELKLTFAEDVEIHVDGELWDKKTALKSTEFIEFKKGDDTLWRFAPLMYWDSAKNKGVSPAILSMIDKSCYISITVPYQWLSSATYPVYIDADITIDALVLTFTHTTANRCGIFWTSTTTGYVLFLYGPLDLYYRKTTDGGANWADANLLVAGGLIAVDCWADWQTPGDSGTKIHIVYNDSDTDEIAYMYLDTSDDSEGTPVNIEDCQGSGQMYATQEGRESFHVSITKTVGGNLVTAFIYRDNASSYFYGSYKSSNGSTWTSIANPWESSAGDYILLYPANLADTNDLWGIFWDISANALSLKTYDDSGNSWSEAAIASSMTESTLYLQFDGAIRFTDGHLILAAWNLYDNAAADLMCWDITDASTITAKTNIITNTSEYFLASVFIDQSTDDIYVAYVGGSAAQSAVIARYQKSTNGGTNWSGDTAFQADSADDERWVSAGAVKKEWGGKFAPVWFNDDLNDLFTNVDNAITINAVTGGTPDISNTPTSKDFGIVDPSTTYYAYGSAPSNPVADGECTFTVSNNSSAAIDLSVNGTNFTGGSTWYLGSGSPDATHCRVTVYCSGQNPASGVVLSTTPQSLYSNLADAATLKWDFKLETPSFDPTSSDSQKTMTITLIATLH